jgi:hypothetical protein
MLRLLTIFFVLFHVASAAAKDIDALKGSWVCKSGCGCTPASPRAYTSIAAEGVVRNECGAEAKLTIASGHLEAAGWGAKGSLGATVSADKRTINWDNQSVWVRLPADTSELETRRAYWESRAFYCRAIEGQPFPSKFGGGALPSCDDGDSIMFNSLLCRAGDPRGCNTIKLSQDSSKGDDGRFWRSPNKLKIRPAEGKDDQTTFSGDHAVGLFLYFGHTRDTDSFKRWIHWIGLNERCTSSGCGASPPGTPRYCKDDRCAFRFDDCPTLLLLADRLNVGVPFCSPNPIVPVPTVESAAQELKKRYDATLGMFPIQPPDLKLMRDNFDKALKAYEDATATAEQLRTKLLAGLIRQANLVQIEKALTARLNQRGYARHNALLQIMMLQDWGLGTNLMSSMAKDLANEEPANPFFQYVAHRREGKPGMLPVILRECPNEKTDPKGNRSQWSLGARHPRESMGRYHVLGLPLHRRDVRGDSCHPAGRQFNGRRAEETAGRRAKGRQWAPGRNREGPESDHRRSRYPWENPRKRCAAKVGSAEGGRQRSDRDIEEGIAHPR